MNPFRDMLQSGRVRNEVELQSVFWRLAKKIHPDTSEDPKSHERFIRLREDFLEALRLLPAGEEKAEETTPKSVPTRREIIAAFGELVASSFPADIRVRSGYAAYGKRIAAFSDMLSAAGLLGEYSFFDVEREMNGIRGQGDEIIFNSLYHTIRMIFSNAVSYHFEPKKYAQKAVEKWFSEIETELEEKGYLASRAFLRWIVEDLRRGGAF